MKRELRGEYVTTTTVGETVQVFVLALTDAHRSHMAFHREYEFERLV
jgi:hypothetical protein